MTQTVPDISPLMPMHQDPLLGETLPVTIPTGEIRAYLPVLSDEGRTAGSGTSLSLMQVAGRQGNSLCIVGHRAYTVVRSQAGTTFNDSLSGVPDLWDRNKILSGGDLSHYQVSHCIRVFFSFIWFVFIHHNFQFHFKLCTYCNILDIYLS